MNLDGVQIHTGPLEVDRLRAIRINLYGESELDAAAIDKVKIWGELDPASQSLRGDTDQDGAVDVADAIYVLLVLFPTSLGPTPCRDAEDMNDDGNLNIADCILLLGFLFPPGRVRCRRRC